MRAALATGALARALPKAWKAALFVEWPSDARRAADVRRFHAPPLNDPVVPGHVPSFSIVIPAYQAAAHIGRAVKSVLEQTVPPVEIIVSDDGSTDDLMGTLEPYRADIQVVHGPNGGLPVARNRGFRAASGEFVANLDADDVLYPEWIEAVGELAAARPDLDILTTNGYRTYATGRRSLCYSDHWVFEVENQRHEILRRNFILAFAAVRRTRFLDIGGFDEEILSAWELWLRLLVDGSRAGCVDEALFEYTMRAGSLSTAPARGPETAVCVLAKALSMDLSAHEREEIVAALASERLRWEREMLHFELASGQPRARRRALRLALKRGHGPLPRLKMIAAALAPGLAGRVLRWIDRVAAMPRPVLSWRSGRAM
jgi:glycosyltransferase involved in cell wall biosynthesis